MDVRGIIETCRNAGLTLSVAESCTGGLVSDAVVSVPGASDVFTEGLVTYSNAAKSQRLGVDAAVLRTYGAVSGETVLAMLRGLQTDCGIAVSGVAGPGGGTERTPVGTVFLGVRVRDEVVVRRQIFSGSRREIREQSRDRALHMLGELLLSVIGR